MRGAQVGIEGDYEFPSVCIISILWEGGGVRWGRWGIESCVNEEREGGYARLYLSSEAEFGVCREVTSIGYIWSKCKGD